MSGTFQSIAQSNNVSLASGWENNVLTNKLQNNKWGIKEGDNDIVWKDVIKIRLLPIEEREQRTIVRYLAMFTLHAVATISPHNCAHIDKKHSQKNKTRLFECNEVGNKLNFRQKKGKTGKIAII